MPAKKFFKGETFAISGKLSQTQKEYEELIQKHGGEVANSVTLAVTTLISTEDDVKACSQKVALAQGRGLPIVTEGFIGACILAKELLDVEPYRVKGTGKKRKAAVKAAPKKKAKVVHVATTTAVPVIAKSGLEDKAAVVQEEISKGFVKASLAWDVELVLNDPTKAKDKFYNLQLLANKTGDEFWVVRRWGRTGLEGTARTDGPHLDIAVAKAKFKKLYRKKTGNVWGQLGGSFIEVAGKYKHLVKDAEPEAEGLWQYFMHNSVDGKKIAWYNYQGSAAENMEKYWKQFKSNERLGIRFIQTDYFKYEVNFGDMIQTNMKSGTRRVIRRVPAGQTPSADAPTKIPESVKPVAPAAADSSDDEDDEAVDEESDEDKEDDDAEEEAEATDTGAAEDDGGETETEAVVRTAPEAEAPKPARAAPVARSSVAKAEEEDREDEEALPIRRGAASPPLASARTRPALAEDVMPARVAPAAMEEDEEEETVPAGRSRPMASADPAEAETLVMGD